MVAPIVLLAFVTQLVTPAPVEPGREMPLVCNPDGLLFVPVQVDGAAARLVLDTGSNITTLDSALADRLGLPSAGTIASPSGRDPLVTARLRIGEHSLPPLAVAAVPTAKLAGVAGGVDGIFGSDVIGRLGVVRLDLERCRLGIGGELDETGSRRVALDWHAGRPVLRLDDGARMLLDSGASHAVVFGDTAAGRRASWHSSSPEPVRVDRFDGVRLGHAGVLHTIELGSMRLDNVQALRVKSWYDINDANAPDGILPLILFSHVVLDYARGFAILTPRRSRPRT